MKHYCGIDLHSNNHVVVVIDDKDKVVYEKRLSNDLLLTLQAHPPTKIPYRLSPLSLHLIGTGL